MQVNISLLSTKSYQREGKYSNSAQQEKTHKPKGPKRAKPTYPTGQPPTYGLGTHVSASQPKVGGRGGWRRSAEPPLPPPVAGRHVATPTAFAMAVVRGWSYPHLGNRRIHAIKGGLHSTSKSSLAKKKKKKRHTPKRSSASAIARIGRE